jgi:uridine phosphorylase
VKNGKVVASGRDLGKVYYAAVRRVKKDFVTGYIVSGDPFYFQHPRNNVAKVSAYLAERWTRGAEALFVYSVIICRQWIRW